LSTQRKVVSSARKWGIFILARFNPTARYRSRQFPRTYHSKARAMKVVADNAIADPNWVGLYIVKALRGREK
jgi:hypothetical protein